jgi:hypothetical protein
MVLTAAAAPCAWSQHEPAPAASTRPTLRTRFAGRFTGDFDAMLERRLIRLVVPYSPTLFGVFAGLLAGAMQFAATGARVIIPQPHATQPN